MSIDKKSTYYDAGGIDTLDVIKAKLTAEQYKGYLMGNILKYSCRMNYKGSFMRDNEKIQVYSRLLEKFKREFEGYMKNIDYADDDSFEDEDKGVSKKQLLVETRKPCCALCNNYNLKLQYCSHHDVQVASTNSCIAHHAVEEKPQ